MSQYRYISIYICVRRWYGIVYSYHMISLLLSEWQTHSVQQFLIVCCPIPDCRIDDPIVVHHKREPYWFSSSTGSPPICTLWKGKREIYRTKWLFWYYTMLYLNFIKISTENIYSYEHTRLDVLKDDVSTCVSHCASDTREIILSVNG
jgi:hypothetical protein